MVMYEVLELWGCVGFRGSWGCFEVYWVRVQQAVFLPQ